jgi:Cu(I)/Ag(I) efflux system membrane protein CusA/SilA
LRRIQDNRGLWKNENIYADARRSGGAIMAGLLPIMWSNGTGSEIMQRIAVPMIGGMISSTLLTLIVIPAIFGLVKGFGLQRDDHLDRRTPPPDSQPVKRLRRIPEPAE